MSDDKDVKVQKKLKKEKKEKKKKRTKEEKEARKLEKKRKRSQKEETISEVDEASAASPKRPRTRSFERRLKAIACGEQLESSAAAAAREAKKVQMHNSQPLENFEGKISAETIKVLKGRGMTSLFEIQVMTFGPISEGKDVVGRARTGMGKTLAFSLPVIELLKKRTSAKARYGRTPSVCIMAPTRELAKQVAQEFALTAPHLALVTVYGGTPYGQQIQALRAGVDIVCGTPGRMCDLIERGSLVLAAVDFLILDEADQMLDMGFKDEMDKVFNGIKEQRSPDREYRLQTLLFSATMPKWVAQVAREKMNDPVTIDLVGLNEKQVSKDVEHMCCICPWQVRAKTISDLIRMYGNTMNDGRTIIFQNTKKDCNELACSADLMQEGKVLHGDIAQSQREATLQSFRNGKLRVLIATDVAARGLDISGVDLVLQGNPPCGHRSNRVDVESYTHRSGRTGRAGRKGRCITLYKWQDEHMIKDLERAIKTPIKRIGAPQPIDLCKFAARELAEKICLNPLDKDSLDLFTEAAEALNNTYGAETALKMVLAQATGFDETALEARSLLQSAEGYITVMFQSDVEMHGLGYIWSALRNNFPPDVAESARGMSITLDGKGACFDISTKHKKILKEVIETGTSPFTFPTTLPALKPKERRSPAGRSGGGGRSWGGRGRGRGGGGGYRRGGGGGGYRRGGGGGGYRRGGGGGGRGRW